MRIALIDTTHSAHGSMASCVRLAQQALQQQAPAHWQWDVIKLPDNRVHQALAHSTWPRHLAWASSFRMLVRGYDLVHIIDGSHAYLGLFTQKQRVMVTVNDLIPILVQRKELDGPAPSKLGQLLWHANRHAMDKAHLLTSISATTAADLERLWGLSAIPLLLPLPPHWQAIPAPQPGQCSPYLVSVGNGGFYKNRPMVLKLFAALRQQQPQLRLRLIGGHLDSALATQADQLDITHAIDCQPDATDEQIQQAYLQAELLLFPSVYEGFGWPPLEAMAHGCPVVCSHNGSLGEVVGDGARTAEANDFNGLLRHCQQLLSDSHTRQQQIKLGYQRVADFSMQGYEQGLLKLYQQAMS